MGQSKAQLKITVAGAGFGGLFTFRRLARALGRTGRATLTLVNRRNYFLFTPLLHEVATGAVSAWNIVEPLRNLVPPGSAELKLADIVGVDRERKVLLTSGGDVPYDILVLAPGSEADYFDVPGARELGLPLKTLDDALALKRRLIRRCEDAAAASSPAERRRLLSFAVVGGGPTGVELISEMEEFLCGTLKSRFTGDLAGEVRLTLVNRGPELLAGFPPRMRAAALRRLRGLRGVAVLLDTAVTEVGERGLKLDSGGFLETSTTAWVAGVKPTRLVADGGLAKDAAGRFFVDECLRTVGDKSIFVLGDAAHFEQDGQLLPGMAQVAAKQATAVAENVLRTLDGLEPRPFRFRPAGYLVSLGRWAAAAQVAGLAFGGPFAWWLWRTIYLSKMLSPAKKLRVAIDWTMNLFAARDISETI